MAEAGLRWVLAGLFGWVGVTSCAVMKRPARGCERLPAESRGVLESRGWGERVGRELGIWISARQQRLYGIRGDVIEFEYPCSTALRGLGEREGSYQTPRGWHVVADRIGDGLPVGAVIRDRVFTGEVMLGQSDDGKDHVLTRVIRLQGVEPGLNQGPGVDSYDRYIYIHGTSAENRIGTAASMGCIRMCNSDILALYDCVATGTAVLVTEE